MIRTEMKCVDITPIGKASKRRKQVVFSDKEDGTPTASLVLLSDSSDFEVGKTYAFNITPCN